MTGMNEDRLREILKAMWENNGQVPVSHNMKGCRLDLHARRVKDNIIGYIAIEILGLEEAKKLLDTQILCQDHSFPLEPDRDLILHMDILIDKHGMDEYRKWTEKHGSWSQAMGRIRTKALKRRGLNEDGNSIHVQNFFMSIYRYLRAQ
jgi:hypothetical protein